MYSKPGRSILLRLDVAFFLQARASARMNCVFADAFSDWNSGFAASLTNQSKAVETGVPSHVPADHRFFV